MKKKKNINFENIEEAIRLNKKNGDKILFEDDFKIIYTKDGFNISGFELTDKGYNQLVEEMGSFLEPSIRKGRIETIYGIKMVVTNE